MTALPVLETERLRIRPFTPDDLHNAHKLYTGIGWVDETQTPTQQLEQRRHYIAWNALNHRALADLSQMPTGDRIVELKANGTFVGACGIMSLWLPMGQLPSLGGQADSLFQAEVALMWAILPDYWGQGYAPEAARALVEALFGQFRLQRIIATTEHGNQNSQRVMQKIGMTIERNPFPEPAWFQTVGIINYEI